jgi:hypothetical protein
MSDTQTQAEYRTWADFIGGIVAASEAAGAGFDVVRHADLVAAFKAGTPADVFVAEQIAARGQPFADDRGSAACQARQFGAVTRRDRFGAGGAWVGFDYLNEDGRVVLASMAGMR